MLCDAQPWTRCLHLKWITCTALLSLKEHFLPHAMLFRLVEHDATSGELRLLAPEEVGLQWWNAVCGWPTFACHERVELEVIADFQPLVDCLADIFVQVLSAVGVVGLRRETLPFSAIPFAIR